MGRTKLFLTNQPQLIDMPSKGFWSIMLYNCICPFHCFVFYRQFCCSRLNWNARSSVQNCLNPFTPYNINCVYSLIQLLDISTIVFLHILEWMKLSFLVNMAHTSTNFACFCLWPTKISWHQVLCTYLHPLSRPDQLGYHMTAFWVADVFLESLGLLLA